MASDGPGAPEGRRRLIVNADDFGRSASINRAVIEAHQRGILTSASLMVNESACDEAVELARKNPKLGVGLHLTLLCGRSALPQARIPGLVNSANEFTNNSVEAGLKYFFKTGLRDQLRSEIHAQFGRFKKTGLPLDHVNGHLHLHLHPVIFKILMQDAGELGITKLRLTADPLWLNLQLGQGHLFYRLSHALVFNGLVLNARPAIRRANLKHTHRVFGLLQNARVTADYVERLVAQLPPGDSELYSHPSLDEFRHEFDALLSPRVRSQIEARAIELIRYQDL